jgi:hypothetical protein
MLRSNLTPELFIRQEADESDASERPVATHRTSLRHSAEEHNLKKVSRLYTVLFWLITAYSLVGNYQHLRGNCCLLLLP